MRIALLFAFCVIGFAQVPERSVAFEVASVNLSPHPRLPAMMFPAPMYQKIDDAQVQLRDIPLLVVIEMAYGLPWEQISGPDWMLQTQINVRAKLPDGSTQQRIPEMLQSMLTDRFKLAAHRQQKAVSQFELKLGSGALKLKPSVPGEHVRERGTCSGGGTGHHRCYGMTMEDLAQLLTDSMRTGAGGGPRALAEDWAVDRSVIDATGLTGEYDFVFDYGVTPERRFGDPNSPADVAVTITMLKGIQALGLKLVRSKRAFEYLIVDHIERIPTEN